MSNKPLSGLAILVVEDVVDNQDLFRIFLESAGARVDIAVNGADGSSRDFSGYDLVIMDVQMPVLDGLSATRMIRAKGVKIPIIALTAHAMPEEVLKSKEAGCTDHVPKPVSSATLIAAVLRNLNQS